MVTPFAHFSDNAEMKARFEREARTLASPNTVFAGDQNLRRKILISFARQVFQQRFRSSGRSGDSIARPPNLWPGTHVSVHNRFASCETNSVHNSYWRSAKRIRFGSSGFAAIMVMRKTNAAIDWPVRRGGGRISRSTRYMNEMAPS
jgi:hypothetical protein